MPSITKQSTNLKYFSSDTSSRGIISPYFQSNALLQSADDSSCTYGTNSEEGRSTSYQFHAFSRVVERMLLEESEGYDHAEFTYSNDSEDVSGKNNCYGDSVQLKEEHGIA